MVEGCKMKTQESQSKGSLSFNPSLLSKSWPEDTQKAKACTAFSDLPEHIWPTGPAPQKCFGGFFCKNLELSATSPPRQNQLAEHNASCTVLSRRASGGFQNCESLQGATGFRVCGSRDQDDEGCLANALAVMLLVQ